MSKRKSTSAAAADTYDSDNGFVEDAPRGKKAKTKSGVVKTGKEKGKSAGAGMAGGGQVGKNGECFWELTKMRRVGISEFKGKVMVDVREYYEKDGEALPGKKGISLPVEQLNTLIKLLPHIETVLAGKGQSVERPDYSGAGASTVVDDEDDEDDEEDEEMEKEGKKNFEATSDED